MEHPQLQVFIIMFLIELVNNFRVYPFGFPIYSGTNHLFEHQMPMVVRGSTDSPQSLCDCRASTLEQSRQVHPGQKFGQKNAVSKNWHVDLAQGISTFDSPYSSRACTEGTLSFWRILCLYFDVGIDSMDFVVYSSLELEPFDSHHLNSYHLWPLLQSPTL